MINILVIEDNPMHFEIMINAIKKDLNHLTKVFPINIIDKERNLHDLNFLIAKMQEEKFQEVIDYYDNIDLFIVDATLTPHSDKLGVKFTSYLQKNYKQEFKAIIVSNTAEIGQMREINSYPFVSKIKHGINKNYKDFSIELIDSIKKQFMLGNPVELKDLTIKEMFISKLKEHGFRNAFHKLWIVISEDIQRHVIDKVILLVFYLLILTTSVYGGYNILHYIFYPLSDKDEISKILKTSEHIFISFLPMFVVLGFFLYYITNIRIFLLEGNLSNVNEEDSTKTMNLTKRLFVSSIISYVLINIVEEVLVKKGSDISNLISSGVLLVTLIIYYFVLNVKRH